jgi:hypothetical protein
MLTVAIHFQDVNLNNMRTFYIVQLSALRVPFAVGITTCYWMLTYFAHEDENPVNISGIDWDIEEWEVE